MGNYQHLYLHGFASSPKSTKALYFQQRYHEIHTPLTIMDFNQPDFTNLSLSRQINQVTNIILNEEIKDNSILGKGIKDLDEGREKGKGKREKGYLKDSNYDLVKYKVGVEQCSTHNHEKSSTHKPQYILIGSSFGGLTASWVATQNPDKIKALILLAPAFNFAKHLRNMMTEDTLSQWQKEGYFSVYHYGDNQQKSLHYQFWTDLLSYNESLINHSIPTLIFHGVNDETIPLQSSRDYVKTNPNAILKQLDSDHSLNNCLDDIWHHLTLFRQSL